MGKSGFMKGNSARKPGERPVASAGKDRSGEKGGPIRFAVARTDLGWVLVAGTGRGLCAIHLGDSREALIDALKARFAKEDISVPVTEEEVVVKKRPVVREEVRIRTEANQEQRPVSASVRREEVDVDRGEGMRPLSDPDETDR